MSGPSGHVATALAAGAMATNSAKVTPAVRDRLRALRRAIGDLDEEARAGDPNVIITAKELLGLLKIDDDARAAVEPMIAEVEAALLGLSALDVDALASARAKARPKEPAPKEPSVTPPTTSRRFLPPEEPSKTELERTALPIWQRTDRFFTKGLVLLGAYIAAFAVYWLFIRTPPDDAMQHCKSGDAPRCWEVVAVQDTIDSHKISPEPLHLLCERDKDPCACAGLAYLDAADPARTSDCSGLAQATTLDPTWPCSCTRYGFWRWGKQRTAQCGIARCE